MTGKELNRARRRLGMTMGELGKALRLQGSPDQVRKRIAEMETGRAEISGPVSVAVEAMLAGFWPEHVA